ncbi:rhodanese-related sulfurtransferase [Sphingomonas kyeonggiensis]|uniref:sulfurtransferase/chromate resistance protein n=1 Tax=Sphingomonas kyeonggiensis TaxID=1268553 RepID=UPI00278821CC|nr:sulfurtransferase/chromate resistance protein [Sphingomonas kyeonggiensis]MDQ0250732.1 rhodanese-related sulfurtransferase [Sphingomonas kyeonggiensis]
MPALNSISVDKLSRLVGTAAAPLLIDIREDRGTELVPASLPFSTASVAKGAVGFTGRSVVVIDEDGARAAPGLAAWLRSEAIDSEVLEGGFAAWRDAGLPLLSTAHLPARDAQGRTLWVTRARPKVDRIACPWLIRRFVDPNARFLFVPPADVLETARRFDAAPFDVAHDEVFWSHRGERCTFDLMVETFGLSAFPALDHLAIIVRGADTARPDIVPEAAGLLAISLGLSRVHADDLEQLEAGIPIYDALYRWCRDARSETHDWASHKPREVRA